jgi:SAM-dependent methyltransferase
MDNKTGGILAEVIRYYSDKLAEHGETPRGVDWNSAESQVVRFKQLSQVINSSSGFSINDLGCGYGALLDYLRMNYHSFVYNGFDVSADMIDSAHGRYLDSRDARFTVAAEPLESADYGVASGIFNVRLVCAEAAWQEHVETTLGILDRTSRVGFSFNCLTSYSDTGRRRDYLYYADPCRLFDLCKQRYSRNIALLHDYGLYEFTIIVRKQP